MKTMTCEELLTRANESLSPEIADALKDLLHGQQTAIHLVRRRIVAQAMREREDKIIDGVDDEWLSAIGSEYMKRTGEPWEVRDGETRLEGLQANVAVLFQLFDEANKARYDQENQDQG